MWKGVGPFRLRSGQGVALHCGAWTNYPVEETLSTARRNNGIQLRPRFLIGSQAGQSCVQSRVFTLPFPSAEVGRRCAFRRSWLHNWQDVRKVS